MATQLDFATRQLANPSAGVQQSLHDLGAMFGQFQKNKLDAEDKAEQRAQRALENKRADAMLSIQQRQADQQAEKFGIDKATIAGTQAASQQLQNATQGLMTPEQASAIAVTYKPTTSALQYEKAVASATTPEARATLDAQWDQQKALEAMSGKDPMVNAVNKAVKEYEASPLLQRQYVSGVDISQTPTQMQVGVDELGRPKMMEVQGDMAKAQELKTNMLRDYDTKIQQNKVFDESQRQFGLKQKLDEAQLAETKRAHKVAESNASKKDDWYTKAKMLGLLNQELSKTDPTKIAEREKERIKDQIAAKDREGDRFAKYLSTVGTGTDAYSYQQWKSAGMPVASDPNYAKPWGTW